MCRATPCNDEVTAEISRRHNDLKLLCLSRHAEPRTVERMIEVWLTTPFKRHRHERLVEKIRQLERELGCP
jgi:ribose 5-phosphate isomerase B